MPRVHFEFNRKRRKIYGIWEQYFSISEKSTAFGNSISVSQCHAKGNIQRSDKFVKLVRRVRRQGGLNGQKSTGIANNVLVS